MIKGLLNSYFVDDQRLFVDGGFRFLCLCGLVIIYAFMGSPTPDNPGVVEAIIGGMLLIVCAPGFWNLIANFSKQTGAWRISGMVLLAYGLLVSLPVSILNGQEFHYSIRDVLPFIFMFIPLFAIDVFRDRPQRVRAFVIILIMAGTVMAGRSLLRGVDFLMFDFTGVRELYYLANVPTVLFACCLSSWAAMRLLTSRWTLSRVLVVGVLVAVAAVTFLSMAVTLQRASLGFVFLYGLVIMEVIVWRKPWAGFWLFLALGLLILPLAGGAMELVQALVSKTQQHGLNMRAEEWRAVWAHVDGSWVDAVFGRGWGATFVSPAVSGARVNFTHNIFSAMILKAGFVGAILTAAYIAGFLRELWAAGNRHFALALAALGPLLIDVLLYAAYKSLDFGLLLLLIAAASASGISMRVASSPSVMYQNSG
jgi:hypothetical protein